MTLDRLEISTTGNFAEVPVAGTANATLTAPLNGTSDASVQWNFALLPHVARHPEKPVIWQLFHAGE